jgi:hypothetical protein
MNMADTTSNIENSAPAPTDPWLFPRDKANEMATAELDRRAKAYQATMRSDDPIMSRYNKDNQHRIDKLLAGNKKEVAHFDELMAKKAEAATVEKRDAAALVDHLTEVGLSPSIEKTGAEVQEYIDGKRSITPGMRAALDAKIKSWQSDSEFQRKLFSGDPETKRLLNIAMGMRLAAVAAA